MGIPMLVDSDWLDRATSALNALNAGAGNGDAPTPAPPGTASRFYDVRPAVLRTAWTWSDDELSWTCKIRFVVGGEQAATLYDVYAPTFLKSTKPPVTNYSANSNVYVVWRGRWEVVSFVPLTTYSGGEGIAIDESTRTISNAGVLSVYVGDSATVPTSARTGAVCFSDEDFVLSDLETDSSGWRAVALKAKTPREVGFSAVYETDGGTEATSTVTLVEIDKSFAWGEVSLDGSTLTLRKPTTRTLKVVTGVTLNSDGSLYVATREITVPADWINYS